MLNCYVLALIFFYSINVPKFLKNVTIYDCEFLDELPAMSGTAIPAGLYISKIWPAHKNRG